MCVSKTKTKKEEGEEEEKKVGAGEIGARRARKGGRA